MKKIIILLAFIISTLTAIAQVPEYPVYRSPLAGKTPYQVVDSALSVRQLKIPVFTTNSLNGYADYIGQSFGFNKTDSTLSVRIASGYANFPAKPWIVNAINNRSPYLTSGSVFFAGTNGVASQDNTNLNWNNTTKTLTAKIVTLTNTTAGTTGSPNYITINFNGFSSRPKASISATEKSSSSNLSGLTFLTSDASTVLQPRMYLDETRLAYVNSSGTLRRAVVSTDAAPANASILVANGTDWNTVPSSGDATVDNTGAFTVNKINSITKSFYDPTSSIQTQLNAKAPSASPIFTTSITTPFTIVNGIVYNSNSSGLLATTAQGASGTVLHGGGASAPAFASISAGDIGGNQITYSKMQVGTTNRLYGTGSGTAFAEITLGTGLSFSGTTLNAAGSSGANPTATAGITAVNGSATTFMRSDAAPKIDTTAFVTVSGLSTKGSNYFGNLNAINFWQRQQFFTQGLSTQNGQSIQMYNAANTFSTQFNVSGGITANRIISIPDNDGTLSLTTATETLTNKTLTTPKLTGYTVSGLPTGTIGMIAYVTDALTPASLAIVVGGGSSVVPVFYNGTNWVVQ